MDFHIKSEVIHINIATRAALWKTISDKFHAGDGFALATLNLDHLVKMSRLGDFRRAYTKQDMIVADGNPIVWLSKIAGKPVDLMPGSELVIPIAQLAAKHQIKTALIGSTQAALDKAAVSLRAQITGLEIATCISPSFGFDPEGSEAKAILTQISSSGASLCFLALSAPKQELFAARGRIETPHVGFVSIGAGLDFIAGTQTRAPQWVRKLALEWLWRMLLSPLRLGPRYLRCIMILPNLLINALRQRFR